MADPDLELQGAIVQRLKTDSAVTDLVGNRIYDSVELGAVFPYVTYGPVDSNDADADCYNIFTVVLQLDVWSRAKGFPEVKRIADAVRASLHDQESQLPLPTNALVFLEHRQTRVFRDPDGSTSHAALTFEASIERS
jgi:hypothetical protein